MLEPLKPLSGCAGHGYFVGTLVLSCVLHASALLTPASWLSRESATARVSSIQVLQLPGAIRQSEVSAQVSGELSIARSGSVTPVADTPWLGDRHQTAELMTPAKLLHYASELDRSLIAISVPELEPDYGFADDVGGRVVMDVLIGKDGSVVWLNVDSSDVNLATTNHVARVFRLSRFETPTFRGVPVLALIKIEVDIPAIHQ